MINLDLLAFANEEPGAFAPRERDDETQAYLSQFFRDAAQNNQSFGDHFNQLTSEEQSKLHSLGQ
jgi:importin-9